MIFLAIAILILVMIIVMATIFKRTVKVIDEQSKNYFVCKLQLYDDLIEKKQAQLEKINSQIQSAQNIPVNIPINGSDNIDKNKDFLDISIPDYRDEKIFDKYKKIDEKFNLNHEEIITNFIKEHKKNISKKYYTYLINIKSKITFDITYNLLTKCGTEQLETLKALLDNDEYQVIDDYMKQKKIFQFNEFKAYLNNLIQTNDPYIYIKVSKKEENYNYLDNCIKTIYDPNIFKGIEIIYQNKLYDFGLN